MQQSIWKKSDKIKFSWAEKFKDIFINQKKDKLETIFNSVKFGIHNSYNMTDYCNIELEEFNVKSQGFGLTMDATIHCYDLDDNFFYFSLGKKDDQAVFEAILKWDKESEKAIGNQYHFKIEPKTQFIKNEKTNKINVLRRINIKPQNGIDIKTIVQLNPKSEATIAKIQLDEYLGGTFYSFTYTDQEDNKQTFWDKIKIVSSQEIINQKVLMRGEDHPLFIPNLFPNVSNNKLSVQIKEEIYPVIVYILTQDGEEHFYKYPKERKWTFDSPIINICLTDNLSFDWILDLN